MVDILDISKKDIKKRIFRELAKLFFVTVITLLVGSCIKFSDPTWLFFSVEIIIIVLTFFSLLYVCSKVFRKLFSIYK